MAWVKREVHSGHRLRRQSQTVVNQPIEAYLRDDVSCGHPSCSTCPQSSQRLPIEASHIIIPDATTLDELLEVFELPVVTGFVLLTSVVRKLQRGNLRLMMRLRQLYTDIRNECTLFDNMHAIQTAPSSSEIWNGGDVMKAATWYAEHLGGKVDVVVLRGSLGDNLGNSDTPDKGQPGNPGGTVTEGDALLDALLGLHFSEATAPKTAASRQDGAVLPMHPNQYFEKYWGHSKSVTELVESLRVAKTEAKQRENGIARVSEFKPYLRPSALEAGLLDGSILKGTLHMSRHARGEAVVKLMARHPGFKEVAVLSRAAVNRAMHGDTVAVKLLSKEEWAEPRSLTPPTDDEIEVEAAETGPDSSREAPEREVPALESATARTSPKTEASRPKMPTAEVVAIVTRAASDIVASIEEADEQAIQSLGGSSSRQESVLCVPLDRRLPKLRLRTRSAASLAGNRFVVHLDEWLSTSRYPVCHLVRVLGPINDRRSETESILVAAGIDSRPFSKGAMAELPEVPDPNRWEVPPSEIHRRRDLRGPEYLIFSIDPPGCTDVDDALSVRRLEGGMIEVGVHIADVTHFVTQGSLLDGEAYSRGTTVYLVDRRLDMLPPLLSEHLCSLRAGKDRLAVSVLWTLRPDLTVRDVWFGRSLIRSRYQLEYKQAQEILDGSDDSSSSLLSTAQRAEVKSTLEMLELLTAARRSVRLEAGALELESAELRFETSAEGRREMHSKETVPMMAIVAEMMIWANSSVAQSIAEAYPAAALLRRHPPPRLDTFEEIAELCVQGGSPLDVSSSVALAHSLDAAARAAPDEATALLIKSLATRAMSEAEYFSTGDARQDGGSMSHFGLALRHYTHFTSPIRRYADIVVHRQLLAACEGSRIPPLKPTQLTAAAGVMNERNRQSKRAQRDCNNLFFLMTLHSNPHVESALVYAIKPEGLLLFIPRFQLRFAVHLTDRNGLVRRVLATEHSEPDDPYAEAERRLLKLETDKEFARIVHNETGEEIFRATRAERVWVMLLATGTRAHGPSLGAALLQPYHPAVKAAKKLLEASESASRHPARSLHRSLPKRQEDGIGQSQSDETRPPKEAQKVSSASKPSATGKEVSFAAALHDILESFSRGPNGDESSADGLNYWQPKAAAVRAQHFCFETSLLQKQILAWQAQALISRLRAKANRRLSGKLSQQRQQILDRLQPVAENLAAGMLPL